MNEVMEETKQEEQRGPLYQTSCKDCVFALYKANTQVGCTFDRVEKFKKIGVEVLDCYDDQKEFFVISSVCTLHKHKKSPWAKSHPGRERRRLARQEIEARITVVLVLDQEHDLDSLKLSLDSLKAQDLPPARVIVSLNRDGVQAEEVLPHLLPDWVVQTIQERQKDGSRISRGRCIDLAVADNASTYYTVFRPGTVIPRLFLREIDRYINDELGKFVLLLPTATGEAYVVHQHMHRYVGGHTEAEITDPDSSEHGQRVDSVVQKIQFVAKRSNTERLVKRVEEVCPSIG